MVKECPEGSKDVSCPVVQPTLAFWFLIFHASETIYLKRYLSVKTEILGPKTRMLTFHPFTWSLYTFPLKGVTFPVTDSIHIEIRTNITQK